MACFLKVNYILFVLSQINDLIYSRATRVKNCHKTIVKYILVKYYILASASGFSYLLIYVHSIQHNIQGVTIFTINRQ